LRPMTDTKKQCCCGCGIKPPRNAAGDSEESSTLLSVRFGWRVARRHDTSGHNDIEWRCPACWEDYKSRRSARTGSAQRRT
jgi:hypothetical protein